MEVDLIAAGKRIKQIRQQHNYSMANFSKLIGNSSASTVNNWEKGNNLPNNDRLEKIAILGNTSVDWIRYGEFNEYVQRLLKQANKENKLTRQQFIDLLALLAEKKISYSQDLDILQTARNLFPSLFDRRYPSIEETQRNNILFEESVHYSIEENKNYREKLLPAIEELYRDSKNWPTYSQQIKQLVNLLIKIKKEETFPLHSALFRTLLELLDLDAVNTPQKIDEKKNELNRLLTQLLDE